MLRAFVLAAAWLMAAPAIAQTKEPLPRFAFDLHAASVGLPTAEGWIPVPVLGDTPLPGRGWGVAGGVTAYPLKLGVMTIGIGAALSSGKGKGEALSITTGSGANAVTVVTPVFHTQVLNLVPHLSINFGHKLGWSYLSAGVGRTRVSASAGVTSTLPQVILPDTWNQALNFGGGARWFMKPRLGAGFDVRFIKLGSRGASADIPSARRTQMITFSAGISFQ
jgi:opacity protein-like surface antigen